MVPSAPFEALPSRRPPMPMPTPKMWLARPGKPGNPALWTPAGYHPGRQRPRQRSSSSTRPPISTARAGMRRSTMPRPMPAPALFLRGQASAFNAVGAIWAPRYRQATFGAFLTDKAEADKALDFAYRDVAAAFDEFLQRSRRPPDHPRRPQPGRAPSRPGCCAIGSPARRSRSASSPPMSSAGRSRTRPTCPRLGLPECTAADQAGCILSWQSFAEPADPRADPRHVRRHDRLHRRAAPGHARWSAPIRSPARADAAAPATANLGTLLPTQDLTSATIVAGQRPGAAATAAACC